MAQVIPTGRLYSGMDVVKWNFNERIMREIYDIRKKVSIDGICWQNEDNYKSNTTTSE